jgi:hypothetical protein
LPPRYLLNLSSLDAKGIATGSGGVYLDIVHIRTEEEAMECGFHAAIRHIFRGKQAAAARVGFKRAGTGAEFLRKAAVFRIALTSAGMDIDRARLGKRFHASEAVVGEQDALGPGFDLMQTVAARGVVCPGFNEGGKPVHWRQQGGAN